MATKKHKPKDIVDAYLTTWTEEQRQAWLAVGRFLIRIRAEGRVGRVSQ